MPFSVSCDTCGATFKLSEEIYERRVAGRVVSLHCKKCKAEIRVDGTKPRSIAPLGAAPVTNENPLAAASSTPRSVPAPPAAMPRPIPSEAPGFDWDIPALSVLPPAKVPANPSGARVMSTPVPVIPPDAPVPVQFGEHVARTPAPALSTSPSNGHVPDPEPRAREDVRSPSAPAEPNPPALLGASAESPAATRSKPSAPVPASAAPKTETKEAQGSRNKWESSSLASRPNADAAQSSALRPKQDLSAQALRNKQEAPQPAQARTKQQPPPVPTQTRAKQDSSPQVQSRAKKEPAQVQSRAKQESSPQVQTRAKQESSPQVQSRSAPSGNSILGKAKSEPLAVPKIPRASGELGSKSGAEARAVASKSSAAAPRATAPAATVDEDEDALTVPLPSTIDELPTRRLPSVVSRTPTLPGIPDSMRPPPSTPVVASRGSSPANLWAVSYADDDDRELTTEELIAELSSGALDRDTLVWRQNMPDWCAISDIPELASHLSAQAGVTESGGFQIAEPGRGLLYPTAYYPPIEEEEEDDKTAVFSYDAELLAAVAAEEIEPARAAPRPHAEPWPVVAAAPIAALRPQPAPVVPQPATFPIAATASKPPPPTTAAPVHLSAAPAFALPNESARLSAPPQQFGKKRGMLGLAALGVAGGLLALALILTRGSGSHPSARPAPERKVETPRAAVLPPLPKQEDTTEKQAPPPDPYAAPSASVAAEAPSASAKKDFFELFASAAQAANAEMFDKPSAEKALTALAARAADCRKGGEPPGMVSIVAKFEPSGILSDVRVLDKPYADTPTAHCISSRFLGARIHSFKGEPQSLTKNFMLY